MSKLLIVLLLSLVTVTIFAASYDSGSENSPAKGANTAESIYDFDAIDIEGNDGNLGKYKGKVVMIVNTASQCGYTPQYEGLQAIYNKYKDRGFVILGFPTNDFGGQEPGSNEEIKEFCTLKYKVTFPMFAKITVKGEGQHPLYKYLTDKELFPETGGEITWNFNKFLADNNGKIIKRFSSKDTPESETVTDAIEAALEDMEAAKESGEDQ